MIQLLLDVLAFLAADAIAWWLADRRLRAIRHHRFGRAAVAAFMLAQISYVLLFAIVSLVDGTHEFGPLAWRVSAYVWHLLVLPTSLVVAAVWFSVRWLKRTLKPSPQSRGVSPRSPSQAQQTLSRRDALAAAGVALPGLATAALTIAAIDTLGEFRIRRARIDLPGLPVDLDGLTILQLSDLHIGRFLPPGMIDRVVDAANSLPADLVAFTGDLFDVSAKELAPGIDFIRRLDPRHGLAIIEGNHDVMANADWFEQPMKAAGMPLLLDESRAFRIPGRATPVQFLGMTWGELKTGRELQRIGRDRNRRFRIYSDEANAESLRLLLSQKDSSAFPILLAHHPHVFDIAEAVGLPLTLSGHTHGGQLMLTPRIGVGPLRFRYWTGLYGRGDSRLFVSNGLGSWFPLRVNAPAEITHITLRRVTT